MVEWALWYAAMGIRVFPVHAPRADGSCGCGDKACEDAGKHPKLKYYHSKATTDEAKIRTWWSGRNADDNIGAACGPESNLLVVDVDGDKGRAAIAERGTPMGPAVKSGRMDGGTHYWHAWPQGFDGTGNRSVADLGLDFKGNKGFVIVPPSLHVTGNRYSWLRLPNGMLPEPPTWVLGLLTSRAGPLRVAENRNNHLYMIARRLRDMGMDQDRMEPYVLRYNAAHLVPPLSAQEVRKLIGSACGNPEGFDPLKSLDVPGLPAPDPFAEILRDAPLTEGGHAECFEAVYGGYFRYVPEWGPKGWLQWTGAYWREGREPAVRTALRAVIRTRRMASVFVADPDERAALEAVAAAADNGNRLKSTLALVQDLPGLWAEPDQFDANPDLIATPTETIDLVTMEPREPRREDYITRHLGASLDPDASDEDIRTYVANLFDDAEMPAYIQRAVGYCLTGHTSEAVFYLAVGLGRNGKSVLFRALRAMVGTYAASARWETFDQERGRGVGDDLAVLRGTRLVTVSEPDSMRSLAEGRVKLITGGSDEITCRHLYGRDFSYRPEFKVWMMTNTLPTIKGTDRGIWNRVKPIDFPKTFEGETADKGLEAKLLANLPGILNWALEGLREYRKHGLQEPASLKQEVQKYRGDSNAVYRFVQEEVEFGEGKYVGSHQLYTRFREFCELEEGIKFTLSKQQFSHHFNNVLKVAYQGLEVPTTSTKETRDGLRDYFRDGAALKNEAGVIRWVQPKDA